MMSAGPRSVQCSLAAHPLGVLTRSRYEYLWEDGVRYKRPTKLPAPEYVDALMNWAQGLLDNEELFPNKIGACLSGPDGRSKR